MKTYNATTCHELGYSYDITTPSKYTEGMVEEVLRYIAGYTDDPENLDFTLLADDAESEGREDIAIFLRDKDVNISAKIVHRDSFFNTLNLEKEA